MHARSNESLYFGALLVILGMLALYGGGRWLSLLIPAAVVLWLIASARFRTHGTVIDARVDNRSEGRLLWKEKV